MSGAEVGVDDAGRPAHHLGLEPDVDDAGDPFGIGLGLGDVERQDLTPGMDPGVGPARHHDLGLVAQIRAQNRSQFADHRAHPVVGSQAPEPGTVVGDEQGNANERARRPARCVEETQLPDSAQTSSIFAIGALSP